MCRTEKNFDWLLQNFLMCVVSLYYIKMCIIWNINITTACWWFTIYICSCRSINQNVHKSIYKLRQIRMCKDLKHLIYYHFNTVYVCMFVLCVCACVRDGIIHDLHISIYCLLSVTIQWYIAQYRTVYINGFWQMDITFFFSQKLFCCKADNYNVNT